MNMARTWTTGAMLAAAMTLAGCAGDPTPTADPDPDPATAAGPTWDEVQDIKRELLTSAAANALAQQKRDALDPVALPIPEAFETAGELNAEHLGDGRIAVEATVQPARGDEPGSESLRFELDEPINMLEHSGLAMTVRVDDVTSSEVRFGVRLIAADGSTADILPMVPVASAWGEDEHEIYLDWAFINYADVADAIAVLEDVAAIEFSVAGRLRTPERGSSRQVQPARFELAELRVVDYLQGSYDPNRHSWGWDDSDRRDLTLQHRTQEVTGIVAHFAGDQAVASAIESLDMAARTQCWDGSFLDGRRGARTVTSGEYTHGFTLWGLMDGYERLEELGAAELEETITLGPDTLTRRDAYQRMIYRGAMSRASHVPADYYDDIIGGNTLITGANRVLGYAMAMRRAADLLDNQDWRDEVIEHFDPIMDDIVDAQGAFSGGFPLLAEGNRHDGRGIHYDAGYIRTHMDWLVIGIRATGEPRLIQILDRYQQVIEAAMNEHGRAIMRLISERSPTGGPVSLVLPDATAQIGLEHGMPALAQWGYNVGMPQWRQYEPGARVNHFTFASRATGYSLGAHAAILLWDIQHQPEPRDVGYRFPRQFPIWSSRFYSKEDGEHTRTSRVTVHADGRMVNDFHIEVGEWLETVGIPVLVRPIEGAVTVEAVSLDGWPALLPDDAELTLSRDDDPGPTVRVGETIGLVLEEPMHLVIEGPAARLPGEFGGQAVPVRFELILTPHEPGQSVGLRVINEVVDYEHEMSADEADD